MKKVVLVLAMVAVSIPVFAVELGIYQDDLTKVTLFGEIRTRFSRVMESDHSVNKDKELRFSMNSSRLGVQGTHKLSDTANALGYIRLRYDDPDISSENNSFDVDKSWMGISTSFGTFNVGRIGSIQDDDMAFYDVSSQFGMEISPHDVLSGTGIQDGVIEYGWKNANFRVRAQYFAAATRAELPSGASATLDRGFAVGGGWTADFGLGLHFAYTAAHVKDAKIPGKLALPLSRGISISLSSDQQTLSYGVSYSIAGLSLAAVLSNITYTATAELSIDSSMLPGGLPSQNATTTIEQKEQDLGLSAKYLFDFGLGAYIVYERSSKQDFTMRSLSLPNKLSTQFIGGLEYWPLKKLLSFVELSQIKTKDVKKATAAWAVGTRFYF